MGNKSRNIPPEESVNAALDYKPSKDFLRYLTLVQACQAAVSDNERARIHVEREQITLEIARRRSSSISDIFEKIYVWRMEVFDPSEAEQLCYDDMFPLSVYFDLKALSNFDAASSEADSLQEKALRNTRPQEPLDQCSATETKLAERKEKLAQLLLDPRALDPSKVH